jgi:parallel beta-helix repeat protein
MLWRRTSATASSGHASLRPARFWTTQVLLFSLLLLIGSGPHANQLPISGPLVADGNMTLTADVRVPPGGIGIEVTASQVQIDLNGHEIFGDGTGTGISLVGQADVVVSHGRVRGCAQGLLLNGGSRNRLADLVVQGQGGDGIEIVNGVENAVTGCTVLDNGRMGLLLQGGSSNQVTNNRFQRNRSSGDCGGVTLEYSSNNVVSNNTLEENGAWGMRLLQESAKNLISGNTITKTSLSLPPEQVQPGQPTVSWQPGLVLNAGATGNDVRGNTLSANGFGLLLWKGAVDNRFTGNKATDNHGPDLVDLNAACAANTWSDNEFGPGSRLCDH